MEKVREAVGKELTPTLKPPHRPPKEEEGKGVPGNTLSKGHNRDRILARLKDKDSDLFSQVVNKEITARGERAAVGGYRRNDPATVAGLFSEKTTRDLAKEMGMSERTYQLRGLRTTGARVFSAPAPSPSPRRHLDTNLVAVLCELTR